MVEGNTHTHKHTHTHTHTHTHRDTQQVLCRQPRRNKLTSAYNPIPQSIGRQIGSQILATNETRAIKRHIMFLKRYKSASNQRHHLKPRPSTTGRAILQSTTSEEGDQSDIHTMPYQLDSNTIPSQIQQDTIQQARGIVTLRKKRAMHITLTSTKQTKGS